MEYVKELENQLIDILTAKIRYVREGKWERAAACRDMELYIEGKIREANKALETQTKQDI